MNDEGVVQSQVISPANQRRKFVASGFTVVAALLGFAYFALAYFGPPAPCDPAEFSLVWYASFMARTFDFHTGIGFAVLAIALASFRRFGGAAALLLVALIGLFPTLAAFVPGERPDAASVNLRVMTANLLWVNRRPTAIIEEIRQANPDLLLLQEYTFDSHDAFRTGLGDLFPHRVVHPSEGAFGAAIYSKHPLADEQRHPGEALEDRSPVMSAVLRFRNRELAVYNVHLVPPMWFNRKLMPQQFCQIRNTLEREKRPAIVGGDFNFTRGSALDREIQTLGLREGFAEAGRGRSSTFKVPFLPDIAIDHFYVSPNIVPVHHQVGVGRDSDHRPVVLDLAVP